MNFISNYIISLGITSIVLHFKDFLKYKCELYL